MTAKGTMKGNIVVLDEGEKLPDGASVEVGVIDKPLSSTFPFIRFIGDYEAKRYKR